MEKSTGTEKKVYAPPTITRHGEVVEKTLGTKPLGSEYSSPGSKNWY